MKRICNPALVIVAAGLFLSGTSQAADSVSLRLNWLIGGAHAAYFLGQQRGFFERSGIDLTINEGRGSVRSAQLVAAKSDTFGLSDFGTLTLSVGKGLPIKAVMSIASLSDFAVVAAADSGIKTMKDLEGRKLALTAGDSLTQLFPAVMAANNVDTGKVQLVYVDGAAKVPALMTGQVDALLGGVNAQPIIMAAKGFATDSLRFADFGINTGGFAIHTHVDNIAGNPDLVRRFVKAVRESWEAAIADPEAAVGAILAIKPDVNKTTLLRQFESARSHLFSPNTAGKGIGFGAAKDWQTTIDLMKTYRDLKTDSPASDFFTNEFLPG